MKNSNLARQAVWPLMIGALFFNSGCVATQDWVQGFVKEQIFPVEKRISETEAGMTKMGDRVTAVDARVDGMAKQIADLESRLSQTNAKADQALDSLKRLKPEKKMVLNFTEGAHFASNSIQFSSQAKMDIDSFLSDVSGHADQNSFMFIVAGHTDSVGSNRFNYELSKRRAESIADYLTTERKIDPTRLVVVGYGDSAPVADNRTQAGRAKNRRVEILVYKDTIAVGAPAAGQTR